MRPPEQGKTRLPPQTLILGLGNPYLRDDSVGLRVVEAVSRMIEGIPNIRTHQASVAGFDILDLLAGFDRAVIVDSIRTPAGSPGSVYRLLPEDLPTTERLGSMHEINLSTALAVAREMGIEMPREVVVYAVEVEDDRTFGETCTSQVEKAISMVATLAIREARAPVGIDPPDVIRFGGTRAPGDS